ncbi:3TM-type holin [Nitrospirillum iridis]|uniref:Holin of 3TMs, for gene-transfer release n=1 Tax=Nitrospirillum iridis TaxID=765888 RepID=A0A7X0AWP1_9PROT|nr:3TM-type holin [Nitrospirillum iridis]MBB6251450.1 hypothetical protein [Nitrospirillum iridis]
MGILQELLSPASGVITPVVNKLLDFIPDPTAKAQAEAAAYKEAADRAQQLNLAQLDVNKAEAQSGSVFVAGWRPGAGWVCVGALALCYWPKAVALTWVWVYQSYIMLAANPMAAPPTFPDLGITDLLGLLASMLGMGGLRTFEKLKGVQTK